MHTVTTMSVAETHVRAMAQLSRSGCTPNSGEGVWRVVTHASRKVYFFWKQGFNIAKCILREHVPFVRVAHTLVSAGGDDIDTSDVHASLCRFTPFV